MMKARDSMNVSANIGNRQGRNEPRLHVLLSYCSDGLTPPMLHCIQLLINDLQSAGIEVVADIVSEPGRTMMTGINMRNIQWVILVQTPTAVEFTYMSSIVQNALAGVKQQYLQGILRILVSESNYYEVPQPWAEMPGFDISQDYERALAGILLTLRAQQPENILGLPTNKAPNFGSTPKSKPPKQFIPTRSPKRTSCLLVLTFLIISGIILASFATTLYKSWATAIYAANHNTTTSHISTKTATVTLSSMQKLYTQTTSGTPVINDQLQKQDGYTWQTGISRTQQELCAFTNGAYHVQVTPKQGVAVRVTCVARTSTFVNMALQVDMKFIKNDVGGIAFRFNPTTNTYYWFSLDAAGCYEFYRATGKYTQQAIIPTNCNKPVNTQQTNQLTVIARGSTFSNTSGNEVG